MLKFAIALMLLGSTFIHAAQEGFNPFSGMDESNHPVYESIGQGSVCIVQKDYAGALDNFYVATLMVENSQNPPPGADVVINFCKAVAYDNLGLTDQSRQAIGSMFIALFKVAETIDDADDGDEPLTAEEEGTVSFMKELAVLAPTDEIRNFLLKFLSSMKE